jgi:hypothetical protein
MQGMETPPLHAALGIPSAGQCLAFVAPFLGLLAAYWLVGHTDHFIRRFLPSLEWQRQLGWFNIRAERRAAAVLRWLGYAVYASLALALLGILWSVQVFPAIDRWNDPPTLVRLATHLPVLLVSLGLWIYYLGWELLPKLRHAYETEQLAQFRAEQPALQPDEQPRPLLRPKPHSSVGPRFPHPQRRPR